MIYDFTDIASFARSITYNGKNSFDDFGLLVENSTDDPDDVPITRYIDIPFMDGAYDFTEIGGKVNYPNKIWSYTFILVGDNDAELKDRIAEVKAWVSTYGDGDLYDTDYAGWKYVKARYQGSGIRFEDMGSLVKCLFTVAFSAAPYMQTITGSLIDCLTITPNEASTKYLFTSWAAPVYMAQARYYLSRLTSPGSGSMPGMTISYSTTSGVKSAVVTITAASSSPSYLLMPKVMSSVTITPTQTSGLVLEKEDSDYYYYSRASGVQAVIYLSGFNYSTYSGSQVTEIIKHASWQYPDNQQSFPTSSIPNTSHMRVISEGDPIILINSTAVDASSFELNAYDIISINNSKSVTCKLQYCSIRERR